MPTPHPIPYGRQDVSEADIQAVIEVLKSDFLTQGPAITRFEKAVCDYTGTAHAVAMSNGTAALHLAVAAMGLGEGGLLWTTPITFAASANCARYVGADVDFVDIDPATLLMDCDVLEAKLAAAQKGGHPLPDVVVPVDFGGASCDYARIRTLADEYGFKILQDAAHSLGGRYDSTPTGDCRYADAAMFSFHPVKSVTSGEGGMIVTNDEGLAQRLRLLRSHGITRDQDLLENPAEGPWYYEQVDLGYNYRITDIQAALGASQMTRLDDFVARRNVLARRYQELLASAPVSWQHVNDDVLSAYHLFVIRLDEGTASRAEVYAALQDAAVRPNVHYIPVYRLPYYLRLGFEPGYCPNAERYYERAITLPLYPGLAEADQDRVVEVLTGAVG